MDGDDLPGQIEVPNWDPEHRLFRSMFCGSRGSLLHGKIGGAAGGRWWGGVYGWAHTTITPHIGVPKSRLGVTRCLDGFGNALILTGDERFLEPWRSTLDGVNANSKVIDGVEMYPRMHNADGWYEWETGPYDDEALDMYYWSMGQAEPARSISGRPCGSTAAKHVPCTTGC